MEYGFAPILIDRAICRDFDRSSALEWLVTNSNGGYAMGTVAGVNTRRYHGLLVAALDPPAQRHVILSNIDEQVVVESDTFNISTEVLENGFRTKGYELLDLFRLDPYPIWVWELKHASFTKRLFLIDRKPAAIIQYTCNYACTVRARLYIGFRDYHDLMHANDKLNGAIEQAPGHFTMQPYANLPAVKFSYGDNAVFTCDGKWERGCKRMKEVERGMDAEEDLYSPGLVEWHLDPGQIGWIVADLEGSESFDEQKVAALAEQYRHKQACGNSPFEARLTSAADQFRAVRNDNRPAIMAGWPWFASWGRDTMVSLPGLLITRGLFEEATGVIEGFLAHLNQGLIPNHFPDIGAPEYNTVDATLWMFQAVWSYVQCGGGLSWVKDVFYPAAKTIIRWHERGTIYEIRVDPEDGLLSGGCDGTMLTWMDAKVGDWVVTPRRGKPVEVNALWYNALRILLHWAGDFEDVEFARELRMWAKRAQKSFNEKFWNADRRCLYDVVDGPEGVDPKLRPNQIFAVSLPFPILDEERRKDVVRIVESELLTPYGLRSLERGDPDYRPKYEGDRVQRDGAYHNGTVWPWLIGPFITAYLRAFGRSAENIAHCRKLVDAFEPRTLVYGLGSLSEVCDGDPPHQPRGCISQAWSVAELLRVLRSDLASQ